MAINLRAARVDDAVLPPPPHFPTVQTQPRVLEANEIVSLANCANSFLQPLFFSIPISRARARFLCFFSLLYRIVQNRGRKRAGWVLLLPIPTRFVLSGDYFRSHAPVKYASNNAVVTRFYDFLLSQLCPTTTTALHVHTKLHLAAEIQACFLLFLREVRKSRCDRRNEGYTCPTIDPPFCYSEYVSTWSLRRPRKTYEPRKRGRERKGIHFYCRLPPKKVFARLASSGHEKVSRLAL